MGEVAWLGRYPVKSMLGEELADAVLDESGVAGDRRYALIDEASGLVASAKNPAKWRQLLGMTARYRADGRVTVTLPDGALVEADDPLVDALLSRHLGRPVRLAASRPEGASIERLTPPTEPSPGVLTRGGLAGAAPGHSFVDFAPVHVVTTATLEALASAHPRGALDARRFRPNIVLRMFDPVPFAENGWVGRTLSIGADTRMRVLAPTPRCVVPTLAQGRELAEDREALRTAARANRVQVLDLGVLTCVGAYATVRGTGQLRVGDRVLVGA